MLTIITVLILVGVFSLIGSETVNGPTRGRVEDLTV